MHRCFRFRASHKACVRALCKDRPGIFAEAGPVCNSVCGTVKQPETPFRNHVKKRFLSSWPSMLKANASIPEVFTKAPLWLLGMRNICGTPDFAHMSTLIRAHS